MASPRLARCMALRARSRALWAALGEGLDIPDAVALAALYVQLELARYDILAEYLHERYRRTLKGAVSYSHHRF